MPKIDQEPVVEQETTELDVQYMCSKCGSIHHYLPSDKRGCRKCRGNLIRMENSRSKIGNE